MKRKERAEIDIAEEVTVDDQEILGKILSGPIVDSGSSSRE
jgi:hypothetical protein